MKIIPIYESGPRDIISLEEDEQNPQNILTKEPCNYDDINEEIYNEIQNGIDDENYEFGDNVTNTVYDDNNVELVNNHMNMPEYSDNQNYAYDENINSPNDNYDNVDRNIHNLNCSC